MPQLKTKIKKQKKEIVGKSAKLILDLGCGQNRVSLDGLLSTPILEAGDNGNVMIKGVDFVKCEGVDVVHDLTKFPYPFKDGSVDGIFSSHFVEHLDGFERAKFMDECYRILKMGGKMRLIHPYGKSVRAVQDYSHKWPPIVETSYLYFDKNWREANKLTHGNYDIKSNFKFWIYYSWQDATVAQRNEETRNFWCQHYVDVIADLIVDLEKI